MVLAVGLAAVAVHAQQLGQVFSFDTNAGQEVRVHQYARWNGRCEPEGEPTITMLTPPGGGRIDLRREAKTDIGAPRAGGTDCRGKAMPALSVYYIPRPEFHGADHFDYQVAYGPHGTVHDSAFIQVR